LARPHKSQRIATFLLAIRVYTRSPRISDTTLLYSVLAGSRIFAKEDYDDARRN
jgi:hypothetical protein